MAPLERLQALSLRAALDLPERVQRRLAGPPVTIEGQTLATDTQLMLRLNELAGGPAPESLPIPGGRLAVLRQARIAGGRQPVGAVREVAVGGRAGRLYVPSGAAEPGPLLVFFHGGAFVYGDLDSHDAGCRFLAERSGVRVLAVDYRLAPEHPFPAAVDDAVAAYREVVADAAALGADSSRLAVGGDSAGGNLAAVTAITAAREGLPLALQLLVYPVTDMRGEASSRDAFAEGFYLTRRYVEIGEENYLPRPDDVTDPRASPLLAELPTGLAPAYVVTAGFDPLRDEGEAYARRLQEAGVPTELRRFPDQVHGFFNVVGAGRSAVAANAVIAAKLRAALV